MKKKTPKKFIHVNQHHIRKNIKNPELPVITIKQGATNTYCNAVAILGPSKVIYGHEKKLLGCGARVVIETEAELEILE